MGHELTLSSAVIEAAIDVHKQLGPGYLETIYENAMKVALRKRCWNLHISKMCGVFDEGEDVGLHRLDIVVRKEIVVELKAIKKRGGHLLRPGAILLEGNGLARRIADELQRSDPGR